MFLEPHFKGQRSGWIEVVCGSMFSGKTEELIRRLKRARIANQVVKIYKPMKVGDDVNVVGIDEAQFFDDELPDVCQALALRGIRVILSGLDMDYMGKPFGPMPALLSMAEYITKLHAICSHCGNLATHSYRLVPAEDKVLLGEKESYEARCRTCYAMGNILDFRKKETTIPDVEQQKLDL